MTENNFFFTKKVRTQLISVQESQHVQESHRQTPHHEMSRQHQPTSILCSDKNNATSNNKNAENP